MEKKTGIHQLFVYFTLAYLISWILWLPLYGPAIGIEGLPVLAFHHGIGGLGPMIAAFISSYIFEKKEGVKQMLIQMCKIRPLTYIVIALLSPFALAVLAELINSFVSGNKIEFTGLFTAKEFPEFSFVGFAIYNLAFFGMGEETGWRGFALPRLQARYNALWSSVVLALFWAIWHWPLFLYRSGYMSMGFGGAVGWVFSLLTGSILLTWLYNSARAGLLACAIFHSTIDIAFLADFANPNTTNYMGMLITVWGIATIIIFKPTNLSHKERISK